MAQTTTKKALTIGCLSTVAIFIIIIIVIAVVSPPSSNVGKSVSSSEQSTSNEQSATREELQIVDIKPQRMGADDDMLNVHVTVKNLTDKLITGGGIKAIFYDKSGKLVGTAPGTILNLPAGEKKVVDCLTTGVPNAARTEVQVEYLMYE